MHVHEEVLLAAREIALQRGDWTFTPHEVVQALPVLNESSVRTHVVSRCCVNAPKNHLHKWDYFKRVGYGKYEVRPKYRESVRPASSVLEASNRAEAPGPGLKSRARREIIHAVIHPDADGWTGECLEVAVVTQGKTLDEVVNNLKDALALHLEGEDLAAMGFSDHLRLQISIDTPLEL